MEGHWGHAKRRATGEEAWSEGKWATRYAVRRLNLGNERGCFFTQPNADRERNARCRNENRALATAANARPKWKVQAGASFIAAAAHGKSYLPSRRECRREGRPITDRRWRQPPLCFLTSAYWCAWSGTSVPVTPCSPIPSPLPWHAIALKATIRCCLRRRQSSTR